MSYAIKNRVWCGGSNTIPSSSELAEAMGNERKFQCSECGRLVQMTRTGLIPTHLATRPASSNGASK